MEIRFLTGVSGVVGPDGVSHGWLIFRSLLSSSGDVEVL